MNKKHYLKPEMRIFELRAVNVICGSGNDSGDIGGGGSGTYPPREVAMPKYRTQLWN